MKKYMCNQCENAHCSLTTNGVIPHGCMKLNQKKVTPIWTVCETKLKRIKKNKEVLYR